MQVREGMTDVVLTIGPGHTVRAAAAAMSRRKVGAAIVVDPDAPGPGVITERDILHSIAAGQDPDKELVADHLTQNLTFASPDWSLEQAASAKDRHPSLAKKAAVKKPAAKKAAKKKSA